MSWNVCLVAVPFFTPEPYLCWWSWGSSARVIAQPPHAMHAPTFVPHTLHNSLSNSHVALSHQTVGIHAILVIQCDRIMRFTRQYSTVLSIHNKSERCDLLNFSDLFTFPWKMTCGRIINKISGIIKILSVWKGTNKSHPR